MSEKNNDKFDYDNRQRDNKGRRCENNPSVEMMRNWNWFYRLTYRLGLREHTH